jgi:hypothetical protein
MSISPAQMVLEVASAESAASTRIPARAPAPSATAVGSTPGSPAPAPVITSTSAFSTDRQVDDHHQVYYEFIDKSTGDVVFEIPPEALREIGESLNVPLVGDASVPSVDVNS